MLGFVLGVAATAIAVLLLGRGRSAPAPASLPLSDELYGHAHGTVTDALSLMADVDRRLAADTQAYWQQQAAAASLVAVGFAEADRLFQNAAVRVPLREMDGLRRCHRAARREVLLSAINLH